MRLGIELDAERVTGGEEVSGRVVVLEGGHSRALTLRLSFVERSPSYVEVPFSESGIVHEGDLATGQALAFGFVLPDGAPPSTKGTHGELFWELEAVSDEPGMDTRVTKVVDVTVARG